MCAVDYVSSHGKFPENVNEMGACMIRAMLYTTKQEKRLITPVL
jgi:hypothetical protein